jgi:hypothetical protein
MTHRNNVDFLRDVVKDGDHSKVCSIVQVNELRQKIKEEEAYHNNLSLLLKDKQLQDEV